VSGIQVALELGDHVVDVAVVAADDLVDEAGGLVEVRGLGQQTSGV
jgi:hypothetical protein